MFKLSIYLVTTVLEKHVCWTFHWTIVTRGNLTEVQSAKRQLCSTEASYCQWKPVRTLCVEPVPEHKPTIIYILISCLVLSSILLPKKILPNYVRRLFIYLIYIEHNIKHIPHIFSSKFVAIRVEGRCNPNSNTFREGKPNSHQGQLGLLIY